MGKEIVAFGNIQIEKHKFHRYKNSTFLKDVDNDNILISNKISSGEKHYRYFIGYMNDDFKIKSLHIMLPKTSACVKSYDSETKWTYFLIENDDLLKKYNDI